jgi:serine/threonine protein phosphatase 1
MTCRLDIPLGPSYRDPSLEADLQARLDAGHRVVAIGDVHGHLATFRALIHRLGLSDEDRVVCLGDMIDRGPDSAGMIALVRSDPRIVCIKGNHEQLAIQSITPEGQVEVWQPWLQRGGKSTWGSYIVRAEGDLWQAKSNFFDDAMWMDNLPTQIILDGIRLVHAGYDPRMPLDAQGEKELLWIRKRWFEHDQPVDATRTVVFGHSTTTKVGRAAGDVAFSPFNLEDGRPAWVAMDVGAYNHVAPAIAAIDLRTLRVTKQATLRSERWFETGRSGASKGKKPKRWRQKGNMKEAWIAEHYGLAALRMSTRREHIAEIKARRRLRMAGVVLEQSDLPRLSNALVRIDSEGYALERNHGLDWMHNGQRIRKGPGTEIGRVPPQLPGPTGFRVHHRPTSKVELHSSILHPFSASEHRLAHQSPRWSD